VRNDAVGFFWDDTPPPKVVKEKILRTPPEPTWLADDYLPGLEEALRFPVHIMTDAELAEAKVRGDELVYDTECYGDYWLALFTSLTTGHVTYVECVDSNPLDRDGVVRLQWLLHNFRTSGFNSLDYDNVMCALALAGMHTEQLKLASDELIVQKLRPADVLKSRKVKKLKLNHIDIIEVAPLDASLKTYAGRLHAPKLQDLPFPPHIMLGPLRRAIVRWYCYNDTVSTAFVRNHQQEHIDLRVQLSNQHGVDLRSKSDAQLGEVIIAKELQKLTGERPKPPGPLSAVGQRFFYKPPDYIEFQSPDLKIMLAEMCAAEIEVGPSGHCIAPKAIREQKVMIGGKPYTVGMGGLHSKEKRQAVVADKDTRVIDRDVTGYYPNLILKNGFFPPHLGRLAQVTYQSIVDRRTNAKPQLKAMEYKGQTDTPAYAMLNAEVGGLKIACNGAMFGKTSDPWSILYAPEQMVQITITGQLSLLMAIEALELSGIPVVSANTDGIVVACPRDKYDHMCAVFAGWEQVTSLETEETEYSALYAANVNNYIAVTLDGKTKTKGWYCERGSAQNSVLSKNPDTLVCSEAVQAFLAKGTPLEQSIRSCRDIRKFVSVRLVRGGGVKLWGEERPPEYLGKTVRWYYGQDVPGEIVYATSGNKVPRSEGAIPCMDLPRHIPNDLDYDWYIAKAETMLCNIGAASESPLHLDCTPSKCRYVRQETTSEQ
jgi:hypothetical protein